VRRAGWRGRSGRAVGSERSSKILAKLFSSVFKSVIVAGSPKEVTAIKVGVIRVGAIPPGVNLNSFCQNSGFKARNYVELYCESDWDYVNDECRRKDTACMRAYRM
jgi:hypothetical protein